MRQRPAGGQRYRDCGLRCLPLKMSKSAKHLRAPVSHPRSAFKLDAHTAAFLTHKMSVRLAPQASESALKGSLNRVSANRSFHQTSLSPGEESDGSTPQIAPVPAFLRRSLGKESRDALSAEHKSNEKITDVSLELQSHPRRKQRQSFWELGDIEIRLNEKLIKCSQLNDTRDRFLACRQALLELIQANPAASSVLEKIASAVDAWTGELETASTRKRQGSDRSTESTSQLTEEVAKLKDKVQVLSKEKARLTRQLAEVSSSTSFPAAQSHVSDLIKSLQEEVSIHRKREELLMSIINKLREKGYPVGDLQRTPRSDESTRNSGTDSLKASGSALGSERPTVEDREDEECEMSYSPTPGFDAEDSVQMLPSEDRPSIPRLTLPITNDIGHKGVDLRLVRFSPA